MAQSRTLGSSADKPAGNRGKGRKAGVPNKITADIKAMIVGALTEGGGQDWLVSQMSENPVAFMGLIGKVLPMQVTGEDGGALVIRWEK